MILLLLAGLAALFLALLLGAASISVAYSSQLTITETIGEFGVGADNTVTTNGMNTTTTLNASSTPAATKKACFQQALSGGVATISLLVLPGLTADEVVTFTGLKLQYYKFANPSTNANNITITFGAANPHLIFGASGLVVLPPGTEIMGAPLGTGLTIDGTHKNIDISGTSAQALNIELVAG